MSTFYDRWLRTINEGKMFMSLPSGDVKPVPKKVSPLLLAQIKKRAGPSGMHVVSAREVEEWCDVQRMKESGNGEWFDAVVCSPPPFRATWVEYSGENREEQDEALRRMTARYSYGVLIFSNWKPGQSGTLECRLIVEMPNGMAVDQGPFVLDMDEAGKPAMAYVKSPDQVTASAQDALLWAGRVAMMTFQLMNCPADNVPRQLVTPPAGLSKKWKKKHGQELVKYYTLDVGPDASERKKAQQLLDDAKREGRQPPRLHWVRGHFKRGQYVTPERPQGRYCRPFLRGSSASGIVVKDYNVRAPMESTNGEQMKNAGG